MKKVIGSFEKVSFPDFGLHNVIAKIDTGAASGSLHATDIKKVKLATGALAVKFRPYGTRPPVIASSFVYKKFAAAMVLAQCVMLFPLQLLLKEFSIQ